MEQSFLVLGGLNSDFEPQKNSGLLFCRNNMIFSKASQELILEDMFWMSHVFRLPMNKMINDFVDYYTPSEYLRDWKNPQCQFIGCLGERALHIYDEVTGRFFCAIEHLGESNIP